MTGFAHRHIGTDASAQALMLNALGFDSLPAFMEAAVPGHLRMKDIARSAIPAAASEAETLAELRALAARRETPYGAPGASARIVEVLRGLDLNGILFKRFYEA